MSSITSGMDLAAIRQLVVQLGSEAEQLQAAIGRVESAVSYSTWAGPDSEDFRGSGWPSARSAIHLAVDGVERLAQILRTNADAQEQVSGDLAGSVVVGGVAIGGGNGAVGGGGGAAGTIDRIIRWLDDAVHGRAFDPIGGEYSVSGGEDRGFVVPFAGGELSGRAHWLAEARAYGQVDLDGEGFGPNYAFGGEARAEAGVVGGFSRGPYSAEYGADVSAEARADVHRYVGPDGVDVGAGAEASARAEAHYSQALGPLRETTTVGVEGKVGADAHFQVRDGQYDVGAGYDAGLSADAVKKYELGPFTVQVGAGVGVGPSAGANLSGSYDVHNPAALAELGLPVAGPLGKIDVLAGLEVDTDQLIADVAPVVDAVTPDRVEDAWSNLLGRLK